MYGKQYEECALRRHGIKVKVSKQGIFTLWSGSALRSALNDREVASKKIAWFPLFQVAGPTYHVPSNWYQILPSK